MGIDMFSSFVFPFERELFGPFLERRNDSFQFPMKLVIHFDRIRDESFYFNGFYHTQVSHLLQTSTIVYQQQRTPFTLIG